MNSIQIFFLVVLIGFFTSFMSVFGAPIYINIIAGACFVYIIGTMLYMLKTQTPQTPVPWTPDRCQYNEHNFGKWEPNEHIAFVSQYRACNGCGLVQSRKVS